MNKEKIFEQGKKFLQHEKKNSFPLWKRISIEVFFMEEDNFHEEGA
jgi:hypothetical protein